MKQLQVGAGGLRGDHGADHRLVERRVEPGQGTGQLGGVCPESGGIHRRGLCPRKVGGVGGDRGVVGGLLAELGDTAALSMLYGIIERHPRAKQRKHWKAKVRQVLERSKDFVRVDKGVWSFAWKYSPEEVQRLNDLRRERYPKKSNSDS